MTLMKKVKLVILSILFICIAWLFFRIINRPDGVVLPTERVLAKMYDKSGISSKQIAKMIEKKHIEYGDNIELTGEYDYGLARRTYNGIFVGRKEKNNVMVWRGIPYAMQPVGNLRWKAPVAAPESEKVFSAYYFGHSPIQPYSVNTDASFYPQGEDCLHLNIFQSMEDKSKKKPVMVFIYGGDNINGGASDTVYNGSVFAKNNPDVIFVTFDYRLGMLGFVDFDKIKGSEKYAETKNLGIMDQIMALRWIKENITSFGGDPDNITVFGESSGAGNAVALMTSPFAKGLFKRVIAEDGNAIGIQKNSEINVRRMSELFNDVNIRNIDDLEKLTTGDLKVLSALAKIKYKITAYPMPDGKVLPLDIGKALASPAVGEIDFMTGTNKDVANYLLLLNGGRKKTKKTAEKDLAVIQSQLSENQFAVLDDFFIRFGYEDTVDQWLAFISYYKFHTPSLFEARKHTEAGGKTFVYYFTEESDNEMLLGCKGYELRYLFAHTLNGESERDNIFANIIQRAWVNFAKTGNPGFKVGEVDGFGSLTFPEFNANDNKVMLFNAKNIGVIKSPIAENADMLIPLLNVELKDVSF